MSTNPYPVDSATRTCCGGIGKHARDCAQRSVGAVTTWRDLADQLTPKQISDMDEWERMYGPEIPDGYGEWLIQEAQDRISENKRDAELNARIPLPAGVTSTGGWDSIDNKTGRLYRSVQWASFDAGATAVDIDGFQDDTGAIDGPHLSVYGLSEGQNLQAADGRRLAQALAAASDKLDQLTS